MPTRGYYFFAIEAEASPERGHGVLSSPGRNPLAARTEASAGGAVHALDEAPQDLSEADWAELTAALAALEMGLGRVRDLANESADGYAAAARRLELRL
jgi:hypothetical protein